MRYVKFIGPPANKSIENEVINSLTNKRLQVVLADRAISLVRSMVSTPASGEAMTFQTLLNKFQINAGQFSEKNQIPGELSATKGMNMVQALLAAALEPEGIRLKVDVRFDDDRASTFGTMLLYKLTVPSTFLSHDDVLNIDNYIAKYFPQYVPVKPDTWEFVEDEALRHSENYLVKNIDRGRLIGDLSGMRDFLYTDARRPGSGFATTHKWKGAERSMVTGFTPFSNASGLLFSPLISDYSDEDSTSKPGMQFQYLKRFLSSLAGQRTRPSSKTQILMAYLRAVVERERVFSDVYNAMHNVLKKFGRTGIFRPHTPATVPFVEYDSRWINLSNASPFSMLMLIDAKQMTVSLGNVTDIVRYGFSVHEWWQEFTNKYWWIYDHFQNPYWKETDRVRMVQSMMTYDVGYNVALFDEIAGKPFIYSWTPPDRKHVDPEWWAIMERMEKYVVEHPRLFGFANEFYYQGAGLDDTSIAGLFDRVFLASNAVEDETLHVTDLERMAQLHEFANYFEQAKQEGKIIKIAHPIKFEMVEQRGRVDQDPPFTAQLSDGPYRMGKIKIYYVFEDEDVARDRNAMAFADKPKFGIREIGFLKKDEMFVESLISTFPVYRQGITVIDSFEVVNVVDPA
jgi:hypothetical protein